MTREDATRELARIVLGWRLAPGRYLKPDRSWVPDWRFQPFVNVRDAESLLDAARFDYTIESRKGIITARILGKQRSGKASGRSKATAIATAVARSLGLEVEQGVPSPLETCAGGRKAHGR